MNYNIKNGYQLLIEFIKSDMDKKKMTQYRLAKKAGLEQSIIHNFLKGKNITLISFYKICEALNLRPIYK